MTVTATRPARNAGSGDFPAPPPKPNRRCRMKCFHPGTRTGVVEITDKGKTDAYLVEAGDSGTGGEHWYVMKISEPLCDIYSVLLAPDGFHRCCCKGFERWGVCRHISSMLVLRKAGKLGGRP